MCNLEKNNIITYHECGFSPNRSTTQVAVDFINYVVLQLKPRDPASRVFCEISKAFDRVDHNILGEKFEIRGVRGVALSLLRSYLSVQIQFVEKAFLNNLNVDMGYPRESF